jgi:hypothetical protein
MIVKPATSSFVSTNGPSVTVRSSPLNVRAVFRALRGLTNTSNETGQNRHEPQDGRKLAESKNLALGCVSPLGGRGARICQFLRQASQRADCTSTARRGSSWWAGAEPATTCSIPHSPRLRTVVEVGCSEYALLTGACFLCGRRDTPRSSLSLRDGITDPAPCGTLRRRPA